MDTHSGPLVLGIDGGGTQTTGLLATADGTILGRGVSGPSNIQAIGIDAGLAALEACLDRTFAAARLPRSQVAAACLGLAGIDGANGLDVIQAWATRVKLAGRMRVANDATLLLAAGTPGGWGLAVVAGTGSIAFVKKESGEDGRCGGWGYLLGDEGSAFQLVLAGLRAACRAHDRSGPATALVEQFVLHMGLTSAPDLIPAVYGGTWDRAAIAGMAPLVLEAAAAGDAVATDLVTSEAKDLARTAATAVRIHGLPTTNLPTALAGGLLVNGELFRNRFLAALHELGVHPGPIARVADPAVGAVALAMAVVGA